VASQRMISPPDRWFIAACWSPGTFTKGPACVLVDRQYQREPAASTLAPRYTRLLDTTRPGSLAAASPDGSPGIAPDVYQRPP
jgi:hypothetical protein